MSDERIWVTISRGISPELSEPVLTRAVDGELADEEPILVLGLKHAVGNHLADLGLLRRVPLDDGEEDE